MTAPNSAGLSRRAFVKAAVAIGGAGALAACVEREGMPDVPQGTDDPSSLPAEQHAWNDALGRDDHGNAVAPRHQALLFLDYAREGTPSDADRDTVERAFRSLERAYQRANDGLLFTVGYTPTYFDRFDAELQFDLPEPTALSPFENPEFDSADTVVHLASDHAQVLLAVEEALLGERESLNGVEMDGTLTDSFERRDRRTGFVGAGLPAENQDVAGIPSSEPVSEDAPLYMGFKSGFRKSQATEERVTIREGAFAGGTTQHVSRIRLQLEQWYQQDSRHQRVAKMFCPAHAERGLVEGAGDNLGDDSGVERVCPAHVGDDAREKGVVGHTQKSARVREDGRPVILRRDFDSTDDEEAGVHFVAHQRAISDFVDTREAMTGSDIAEGSGVGQKTNNGILQYMSVTRRGNSLVPPRELRALPPADP